MKRRALKPPIPWGVLALCLVGLLTGCERRLEGMPEPGSEYTFSNIDHGVPMPVNLRENNEDLYAPTVKLAHNVRVRIEWYSVDDKSACVTVLSGPYAGQKGFVANAVIRRRQ